MGVSGDRFWSVSQVGLSAMVFDTNLVLELEESCGRGSSPPCQRQGDDSRVSLQFRDLAGFFLLQRLI